MATFRAYFNNERVSTAANVDSVFTQFYPRKVVYPSREEWEALVKQVYGCEVTFQVTTHKERAPKKESTTGTLVRKAKSTEELQRKKLASYKKPLFTCPACGLGPGFDHRMCICRFYNYSVEAWERACGLR